MANVAEKVDQIRSAIYGREVRESIASSIEDMNIECEEAVGGYSIAQTTAESTLVKASSALSQAGPAASAAQAAADRANKSAQVADDKADKIISSATLTSLGLPTYSTPDDAFSAMVSKIANKMDNGGALNLLTPLSVSSGGTGARSIEAARDSWGLGYTRGALPIINGGTGASSAAAARSALGAAAETHMHPGKVFVSDAAWRMGTQKTLPDINKYTLFLVTFGSQSTSLIGTKKGSIITAIGGHGSESGQRIYTAKFRVSGTTVTFENGYDLPRFPGEQMTGITSHNVESFIGLA